MHFRGFNPEAANRGAYGGVLQGIASRQSPGPSPPQPPLGPPRSRIPQDSQDAFANALGAISPAVHCQGTVS